MRRDERQKQFGWLWVTVLGLLLLGPGALAAEVEVEFRLGDTLLGALTSDKVVSASFPAVAGTRATIAVQAAGGSDLIPALALRGPSGDPLDLGGALQTGDRMVRLQGFELPASGIYHAEIQAASGSGSVRVTTSGEFPRSAGLSGSVPDDATKTFDVMPGSVISVQIRSAARSDLAPTIEALSDAAGPLSLEGLVARKRSAVVGPTASEGGGTVTLVVGGEGSGAFEGRATIQAPVSNQEIQIPGDPVIVTIELEGDPEPGATLVATARVEILDRSRIRSFAWSQSQSVEIEIGDPSAQTTNVTLPDLVAYKDELFHVLAEPPVGAEQLPPNVPLPPGEFPGGLPNRVQVAGVNPFALEEAGLVGLSVVVTTTSGEYEAEAEIHAPLPWKPTAGLRTVPVGVPVLLHGRDAEEGSVYDWTLEVIPKGAEPSAATLIDAESQNPWFTPDVDGKYTASVTDGDSGERVALEIYVGEWHGVIVGQDADGRPVADGACTGCHSGFVAPDNFTPWAQTGHAEILTQNLTTNSHYSTNCFGCHSVGFDPDAANGGFDDAADYHDFVDSGLIASASPEAWTTMLAEYPESARLANVQCENCHGPQRSDAHMQSAGDPVGVSEPRVNLSSDTCATCHGEPLRHARFQQWQLSAHANYELATEEGTEESCARCHSANGFLTWLPVLLEEVEGDPLDEIVVSWGTDDVHPQTCVTCHDPHNTGTTSGNNTNTTVRITGDTPPLIAGFTATDVGAGAMCMTCHNSRRGLRNDEVYPTLSTSEKARAPHGSAQGDTLMGQNAYLVEVGIRGGHSVGSNPLTEDTCVTCHMQETPPPDVLAYNQGGANHTFYASREVCSACHNGEPLFLIEADAVQEPTAANLGRLLGLLEEALLALLVEQTEGDKQVDLNGQRLVEDGSEIAGVAFGEFRGRQSITVDFTDGSRVGPVRMNDVDVLRPVPGADPEVLGQLYDFADERVPKSGWNWNLVNNDGSKGVHNPSFSANALGASIRALEELAAQ